jgi:ketosteroid isomerase-like protein
MSNMTDVEGVVRRYVDAFNRGDLTGLKALLAEDAEIKGVMGKGLSTREGRAHLPTAGADVP